MGNAEENDTILDFGLAILDCIAIEGRVRTVA
jgi:hypothetical protein